MKKTIELEAYYEKILALPREDLEHFVMGAFDALFENDGKVEPHNEWQGAEVCQALGDLLLNIGLWPDN